MALTDPCGRPLFAGRAAWLQEQVNSRHRRNWSKIDRFTEALRAMPPAAPAPNGSAPEEGGCELEGGAIERPRHFDVIGDVAVLSTAPEDSGRDRVGLCMGQLWGSPTGAVMSVVGFWQSMGRHLLPCLRRLPFYPCSADASHVRMQFLGVALYAMTDTAYWRLGSVSCGMSTSIPTPAHAWALFWDRRQIRHLWLCTRPRGPRREPHPRPEPPRQPVRARCSTAGLSSGQGSTKRERGRDERPEAKRGCAIARSEKRDPQDGGIGAAKRPRSQSGLGNQSVARNDGVGVNPRWRIHSVVGSPSIARTVGLALPRGRRGSRASLGTRASRGMRT